MNPSLDQVSQRLDDWFSARDWQMKDFQKQARDAYIDGKHGLISVPTGAGKTYAALLGPMTKLMIEGGSIKGLRILYVTPIKALARDVERAFEAMIKDLLPSASIAVRTGDTSAYRKKKIRDKLPNILITTPESLALMLSYEDTPEKFESLEAVIIDEWHELIDNKRGCLLSLNLSYLRKLAIGSRIWGITATLKDLDQGLLALTNERRQAAIITASIEREIRFDILLPDQYKKLAWSGHMGLRSLETLVKDLDFGKTNILFTNTRFQAEAWYVALQDFFADQDVPMAMHHGSLSPKNRTAVEDRLKSGQLKLVVSTSSLDLGVDYSSVEKVYQIGSPKSVARAIQRAGRSVHRPGEACSLTVIPTSVPDLIEVQALRQAVVAKQIEGKKLPSHPLDILLQHCSNRALGNGFCRDEMLLEIRRSYYFRELKEDDLDWVLDFLMTGGACLSAYPEYKKLVLENDRYLMKERRLQQLQRMNMGTISSDQSLQVKLQRGKVIGHVEERSLTRMKPGDSFYLGGKSYALIKIYQGRAIVKPSRSNQFTSPRWVGGRLALTPVLASHIRQEIYQQNKGEGVMFDILNHYYQSQEKFSQVPRDGELLIESWVHQGATHIYLYSFEGRFLNHAIAIILAGRMSQKQDLTISTAVNDFGMEILVNDIIDPKEFLSAEDLEPESCMKELVRGLNMTEVSRAHFRDIARVSCLIWQTYPAQRKSGSQLRSSSSLIYDVYRKFEADNKLLAQCDQEVLSFEFSIDDLERSVASLKALTWTFVSLKKPSSFSIGLISERLASRLSSESLSQRIEKLTRVYQS